MVVVSVAVLGLLVPPAHARGMPAAGAAASLLAGVVPYVCAHVTVILTTTVENLATTLQR